MYTFLHQGVKVEALRGSCATGCLDPGRASYGSLILSPLEPFNVPLLGNQFMQIAIQERKIDPNPTHYIIYESKTIF